MYPKRTILGLTLMGSQAFLTRFYQIDASQVPYYIFPVAIGNVRGPWLLSAGLMIFAAVVELLLGVRTSPWRRGKTPHGHRGGDGHERRSQGVGATLPAA